MGISVSRAITLVLYKLIKIYSETRKKEKTENL